MRPLPVLFAVFILTQTAFAATTPAPIVVEPPDPTSLTPITLYVSEVDTCPPPPVMTREGLTITVVLGNGPCLISPPFLITHQLELGTLPAGTYTVIAIDGSSEERLSFVVLDANPTVRVGQSLGPIAGGTVVDVFTSLSHCVGAQACTPPALTFDGVPATNVIVLGDSHFRATTPPHTEGPVEVRVVSSVATQSSFSFRYYDPAKPPLPELFERILVPVIYNGPGAFGSSWTTEVVARNDNPYLVEPWRGRTEFPAIPAATPVAFGNAVSAPAGIFLLLARDAAPGVKLNAMIRDVSREQISWGTEIPIVREHAFSSDPVELLNVPRSSTYRRTLRIYSLGSMSHLVLVKVFAMDSGVQMAEQFVTLTNERPCSFPCMSDVPSAAVLDADQIFPRVVAGEGRVGITIDRYAGPNVWAFLSLTNNETQQVTVISPQ